MKNITQYLIILIAVSFAGCAYNNDKIVKEFGRRYMEAQHDYCSTNIFVAERGTMDFRDWLLDTNNPTEPAINRDSALYEINGRLFFIEEYIGNTNQAEKFYQESIEANNKYVKYVESLHLPQQQHPLELISSKEQFLERFARENKDLNIGWKK
jgi:hypothetical protein